MSSLGTTTGVDLISGGEVCDFSSFTSPGWLLLVLFFCCGFLLGERFSYLILLWLYLFAGKRKPKLGGKAEAENRLTQTLSTIFFETANWLCTAEGRSCGLYIYRKSVRRLILTPAQLPGNQQERCRRKPEECRYVPAVLALRNTKFVCIVPSSFLAFNPLVPPVPSFPTTACQEKTKMCCGM